VNDGVNNENAPQVVAADAICNSRNDAGNDILISEFGFGWLRDNRVNKSFLTKNAV